MRTLVRNIASTNSITRCRKEVTPRKLAAKRLNARSSTGPRTERGKRHSRFNAVTLGLFAKYIVIPTCDGDEAEKEFALLLDEMHQEFRPVGVYEEWLVLKIAECMWRLRRATRCERGAVQRTAFPTDGLDRGELITNIAIQIGRLAQAEDQLLKTGKLSHRLYAGLAPLVLKSVQQRAQSENENKLVEGGFDRQEFLTYISDNKDFLESYFATACEIDEETSDVRCDYEALLPEAEMERVLRYEERIHRQLDWAERRLLEHQEKRKPLPKVRP